MPLKHLVVDTVEMVQLLGANDQLLRQIEAEFPQVQVHVRGNEITLEGEMQEVARAASLVEASIDLLKKGIQLAPAEISTSSRLLQIKQSVSEVMSEEVLSVSDGVVRPKSLGQKEYVQAIKKHEVVFGIGPAGSGKTYLGMACAVRFLLEHRVSRLILTRPAVEAGEKLGFLPGSMTEKINPYLRPLYDALNVMLSPQLVNEMLSSGTVEVAPLAYMRGRTLEKAFIILDEAQNTTPEQMKMFLTRLGAGSRMLVTGDLTQRDIQVRRSGLEEAAQVLRQVEGIKFCYLTDKDVVRHDMVAKIVTAYAKQRR